MIVRITGIIVVMATNWLSVSADAQEPAAIVDDINAPTTGVAFMDYLASGRVIDLREDGTVSLGYLRSCITETITGGKVVIGREQSKVEGGKVMRQHVECDGGSLKLSFEQAKSSVVLILRRSPEAGSGSRQSPSLTIYGASPVVKVVGHVGPVSIERLDQRGPVIDIVLRNGFANLAAAGWSLKPGGIYRARAGDRAIVFKVDPFARSGPGPIIGRLVAF